MIDPAAVISVIVWLFVSIVIIQYQKQRSYDDMKDVHKQMQAIQRKIRKMEETNGH